MNKDLLYQQFYRRWIEVVDLPPQTIGPLTPVYKRVVPFLKHAPWRILIPVALILVCIVALVHNLTAPQVASLLQRGF
ncbi:TPA: hypothetical protein DIV55_05630 [Patescibacteria group bacterium]|uniref:Uncharacterized protein n=1 Tax=Candidatus Gottesmanbacteria bacterium GW2011_GWA1_43_11 TaxID=1618436 RepID=A0A0G1CIK9_9BACT|nr:MAG: hypothetical protein UV59_C0006G0081 [Candidatus Gottesmanbacteria bacterium GW2011_GWA1_43_11]HCS79189.1 hypothetical protein [Patescibacteria group bacterium]